jgi:hypothetical protein
MPFPGTNNPKDQRQYGACLSRLGGAVVSVFATGPKVCGIFKGDKNPQHTFLSDGK